VRYYTNGLGGVTAKFYTITGQPESQSNPDGSTNAWRYYLDGRINKEIQSNGAYWQTTYDDFNRIVTRIFYSAAGVPEATNSTTMDRRGNAIQNVDAGGVVFNTTFDGLDRPKVTTGPAIQSVIQETVGMNVGGPYIYVTNVLQHTLTNFYALAGRAVTNFNALGEKTVSRTDAIGRPVSTQIYGPSGSLVRESYTGYSADHNSVTVTNGSGASAIVNTTYTDTEGHDVLSIAYPGGYLDYTWREFDPSGNLEYQQHNSSSGGTINGWTFAAYTHDGLNRVTSKEDRDYAFTYYAYDSLGDLTNRTMPGGLQWQASYNNAGQMSQERNFEGGSATRTNTYSYFSSGNAFAGLLQTKTDGRGTSCVYSYDDWLRTASMTCSGSLPEQNLTTTWQFEPRGYLTNITEQFASTNTGPVTSVQRVYYPYGLLSSESVNAGSFGYGTKQHFDAAGRRSQLSIANGNYGFGWQADGSLTSAGEGGSGAYSYNTAGVLTNRLVGIRTTSTTSLDGEGRPFTIVTSVNGASELTENLSWYLDGTLATHTLYRADFTDSRVYSYAALSRRLVQEQQNLNSSTSWTNNLTYDGGASSEAGVLTQIGQGNTVSNSWSGVPDALSRVSSETNDAYQYAAYGHVNGQASLSAWLDGQPVTLTSGGTNAMQWRAMLELNPGVHQLKLSALHPSGVFTAWATNTFTNTVAYQSTADTFDGAGNITQRVWRNPSGTTNRTQTLSWDARGRLHAVTERDSSNSGYNWTAVYDGLNRRLSTTTVSVTNGVALTAPPTTIYSFYDPLVEFLELGVSYGLTTEWKTYGPDLNGVYGGLNGTGGFDAVASVSSFNPVLGDFRGNILAVVTNSVVGWNPSRPTGYGAVPGYRPVPLANGASVAQSSAWRGHWPDITGYFNIGLRQLDPVSGRWLSYDSAWNERDPEGMTFSGGEPIIGFDPDGRCIETGLEIGLNTIQGVANGIGQTGAVGYDMVAQTTWAAGGAGGDYQGASQVYQNIYNNPSSGPSAGQVLEQTAQADANIGTLGLYGMAKGFYTGATTGDYTAAQNASVNSLFLSGAMQGQGAAANVESGASNVGSVSQTVDQTVLSGHGGLVVGDSSPITTVPQGTSLTFWTSHGNGISDALGNAIETGAPITIQQFPEVEGAASYLPGSTVPNYTLFPPDGLNILGNPTTVSAPTSLNTLLQPNMGNINWAACRSIIAK
jgi:YD repeat-containing protein